MTTGPRATAHVCQAASCLAVGSEQVLASLAERVTEAGLDDVAVKRVGCLGLCAAGPLVQLTPSGQLFERVSPDNTGGLVGAEAKVAGTGAGAHRRQGVEAGATQQSVGAFEAGVGDAKLVVLA